MFGLFVWIPKLYLQFPLAFEVHQVPVIQNSQDFFCAFLEPVLKSTISLRLSDVKCI